MKDISTMSKKNSPRKGPSSRKSINCTDKNKNRNGVSLLSMWKIDGRQKSTGDASVDKMSPSKKVRLSPEGLTKKCTETEPDPSGIQQALGYCPNCQMPFAALIKQSANWHFEECMDFDFQHLKECPAGDACSSTILSHYMKFTHYSLARVRSGNSQSPKISSSCRKSDSSRRKSNSPISSNKIQQKTFISPFQTKHSSPKSTTTSISQDVPEWKSGQFEVVQNCISQSKFLNDGENENFNMSTKNHISITEERCSSGHTQYSSNQTKNDVSSSANQVSSAACSSRKSSALAEPEHLQNFQEFKMIHSVPLTFPKTSSPKNITSPVMTKNQSSKKTYTNGNKSNNIEKKVLSHASENVISLNKNLTSSEDNTIPHEIENDPEYKSYMDFVHNRSSEPINRDFLELNSTVPCENSFPKSSDLTDDAHNVADKVNLKSAIPKKRKLDSLYSNAAGSGDTNVCSPQMCVTDIRALAHEFFPDINLADANVSERTQKCNNFDSEDELFILKDNSSTNKKMVQTVISKTLSNSISCSNVALSQVKLEKPSPRKSRTTPLPHKSPNHAHKSELDVSPRKRQTSLMSFFKSSTGHAESTVKIKFAESSSSVSNTRVKQNEWGKDLPKDVSFSRTQQGWNNGGKPAKKCPFYKKISGTTFCVDAFSYGSIPGIEHYFLSHFHYDHYMGLTKSFQHPVYCSVVTANLVSLKIKLPLKFIHTLQLNEVVVIDNVKVTALDANHCPGSVMFLFTFPGGHHILHTGDFRATPAMELYPSLQNCPVERLYLDTTYCNPRYDFPPQDSILELITSLIVPRMKSNVKVLIACGSYTIGKERAFMAIAECIDCKIWAHNSKLSVLRCLEDKRISSRLTTDAHLARMHVLPMQTIKISTLHEYLQKFPGTYDEIIGLKPTGWEHNSSGSNNIFSLKPIIQGPVTIYGVPYSEHSSFSELKKFVQFLRPRCIVPTVNVGNANSRNQMKSCFEQWGL